MTRKFTVTVFAMSLALVGCGSSSTTPVDASPDGHPALDSGAPDVVKTDVVAQVGPEAGQPDVITLPADAAVDTVIPTPGDAAPTDVVSLPTDVAVGAETGAISPDTGPANHDGAADGQTLPPDAPAAGSETGPSITPDAIGHDVITSVTPDAPGTPDAPSTGVDVPPALTPDAALDAANDVLVAVIVDATPDTIVTLDTAVDVETAVDAMIADVEVDSGSATVDSGADI